MFIMVLAILLGGKAVQAKSYQVENMDIQATVNENGSVKIQQDITYQFNGSYNGIYINVPYQWEDIEFHEIVKRNRIEDELYNATNVTVNHVELKDNGTEFTEVSSATNGSKNVYTNMKHAGLQQIKVYLPSEDTTKTFRIDYILENVCVKHNDIGELYYNFIGGAWEVEIEKLNIDIYLPQNKESLQVWGHGPYNGQSKIMDSTHANFKVKNVKPGQYVAARVLFPNENIPNSTKLSNIEAKEIIYKDENAIIENKEEKEAFTRKIVIFAICLFIYWVILMFVFEKDKKYKVSNMEEEKLFAKYNPIVAGCIQGSRTILARDIIAVILGLIHKKVIQLNIVNKLTGKDAYSYIIARNPEREEQMDKIERFIYSWVFGGKEQVNLTERLKEMPKEKNAHIKFKELNEQVEEELAKKGANQAKVPFIIRAFNIFLFILGIIVVVKHIMFNGFDVYSAQKSREVISVFGVYIIFCIPLLMGLLYIPLNLIIMIRHKINKTVQRITGQKVVTTTISLCVFFGIIIALTVAFSPEKYIVADEILICMATILILTDNLMLKNNAIMIEDFSKLNALKDKIENYSLMQDRDVEQITLWEQYLSYAVSFGLANKIMKRMKDLYLDEDLTALMNSDLFTTFIQSDYYMFYTYASLDRRFMKSYGDTTGKMMSGMFNSSSSGGFSDRRRWRIFRRWRILWRRRKWPEEEEPFKRMSKIATKNKKKNNKLLTN